MADSDPLARLTPRERRCLELVALHYDTGQIATELGISIATVNGYLADARQKLGARNRKEAARMLGVSPAVPAMPHPSNDTGMIDRVEGSAASAATIDQQPEEAGGGRLADFLFFGRLAQPGDFGPGSRSLMIVGLVLAMCVALAMAVVAAVGLVSIFTSLRS